MTLDGPVEVPDAPLGPPAAKKGALSPFSYVNDLSYTKRGIFKENNGEQYVPFLVNRSFSFHKDSVLYANEMNRLSHLDRELQHDFYLYGIPKRFRKGGWIKPTKASEDILLLMDFYKYSMRRASEIISLGLLTPEHLSAIKLQMFRGGNGDEAT